MKLDTYPPLRVIFRETTAGRGTTQRYFPRKAGHLRRQSFQNLWQNSALFGTLRDLDALSGACGLCEFKRVCSARAYGMTGDYLGEEPFCTYVPRALRPAEVDAV